MKMFDCGILDESAKLEAHLTADIQFRVHFNFSKQKKVV